MNVGHIFPMCLQLQHRFPLGRMSHNKERQQRLGIN